VVLLEELRRKAGFRRIGVNMIEYAGYVGYKPVNGRRENKKW